MFQIMAEVGYCNMGHYWYMLARIRIMVGFILSKEKQSFTLMQVKIY